MPWNVEDVDRFKKGLSDEQKRRWVAIANGILESCLARENAQRDECERMAIATASSRVEGDAALSIRYDAAQEVKFREENGMLIAEIKLAKPDVYPYHDSSDGKIHYEFKPPEEILSDAFLQQACLLPITDEHPVDGLVTETNIQRLLKGMTGTSPRIEGNLVVNVGAIYDAQLKGQIKRGDKRQVSIGFRTVVVDREGEWEGKKYDRVQTNIRLNHLAFTKAGRCGDRCAIVVDGRPTLDGANGVNSGGQMFELKIGKDTVKFDCPSEDAALLEKMKPIFADAQAKIDGMSKAALEVVQGAEKVEQEYNDLKSKHDALSKASSDVALLEEMRKKADSKACELQKKFDEASGQLEKANAELSLLKGQAKANEDLKATFNKQFSELMTQVDSIVDERLKLIQYVRQKQPHYVYQGKPNQEIKRDLVKMINPEIALDSLDEQQHVDAYLKAWLDMEQHVERAKELALNNITRRVGSDARATSAANALRDQTMKLFGKKD